MTKGKSVHMDRVSTKSRGKTKSASKGTTSRGGKSTPRNVAAASAEAMSDAPIVSAIEAALAGQPGVRVDLEHVAPQHRRIAQHLNLLLERGTASDSLARHAGDLQNAIGVLQSFVSQGTLPVWNIRSDDNQLSTLFDAVGNVIETLRTFVLETSDTAAKLSTSATQVLASSTQHETSSTEQAAAIHETTATMEELKHASGQIAENAGSVARVAEETLGAARAGRGAISEFIQGMQQIRSDGAAVAESIGKLSKRVERIGTVVEVIDEIADRSDLLALNAALEGSRAGEAGKGFSIVAAEMRRLAENVLESTKEIKSLITEIREATVAAARAAETSKVATESGEKLGSVAAQSVEGILAGVQETSDAARVINLATQQQRTATEQVVSSMAEVEDVTRRTAFASKQATNAASQLNQLAYRLAELIRRFETKGA